MIVTSKVLKTVAAILVVLFGVVMQPVNATAVNALITFDSDVPGQPPATGGINQPSFLIASPGTTILVQSSAHGISTKPVVVSAGGPNQFATVAYAFQAVTSGILRVEATVAFDRLMNSLFLETSVAQSSVLVTRLFLSSAGVIQDDITRTTVGQYAANQPFRVRVDIDMTAKSWSAAIDNELNGFDDDPVASDLQFVNPPYGIPSVGRVYASFYTLGDAALGGAVAYDDIRVTTPTLSVSVFGAGTGVVTSNPGAIACSAGNTGTCMSDFPFGIPVTLAATPTGSASFGGWGGDCAGQGNPCSLTMNAAKAVTATFNAQISSARLTNISTRARVETGDNVMIGGFIIGGTTPKTVLVRAIGPSLAAFGVPGPLANPTLQLFAGPTAIAENDDWQVPLPLCSQSGYTCGTPAEIASTGLAPTQPLEAVVLIQLPPGPYTAIVRGLGGTTGVGLIEVFEVDSVSRLANISTRAPVQTGDNVMIGGFIIGGDTPKTVLVRVIGPSLATFGVPGALANPTLRLFSGQTAIAENDNWQVALPLCQQTGHTCGSPADITATGLAPTASLEAAVLITLNPGPYTAIVSGVGGTTGVGLIEVFEVPGD
jgi:hypothetical protein